MRISFKRITSSGNFIPEIDGLRFIAISSVVLFHLSGFLIKKQTQLYSNTFDYSLLNKLLSHGHLGVPLFFVISGLILGIPFAKAHILKDDQISLKHYFLRRLTRLEPPYIIAMSLLLFGAVYIAKTISFQDGILSYLSSIIYIHNFVYPGTLPLLNAPVWSLEIEVQFYIMAPLMALLFSIKYPLIRRIILISTVICFILISYFNFLPFTSLLNYIQYFLTGFLLADIYISKCILFPKKSYDNFIALSFFLLIWLFDKNDFIHDWQKTTWLFIQLIGVFFFYYYVLLHQTFKILSLKVFTHIGGMCYSIYLLHYPIISLFGNPLLQYSFSKYVFLNIAIYSITLISIIIILSSAFFLLIERPCMKTNWPIELIKRVRLAGRINLIKPNDIPFSPAKASVEQINNPS